MRTDITKINEKTPHTGMTEGMQIFAAGTSKLFLTGEWRNNTPVYLADQCKQCLLCTPVCPDSSIPVRDGKRLAFDLDHCKGCGICAAVCPFGAIVMKEGVE
ncbi:MAG: 4Fe-4S binding protein [Clostridiales bacterium]|nr:4Fe-4S binding protein [Clostridiales bacterium]MCD8132832.1 4Fe-4S binding protein [Clostridiales bacterium]